MHWIQVIMVAFAVYAGLRAVVRFRHRSIVLLELLAWLALWTGMAVLAIWPDLSQRLAVILGVGRGVDAVLYLSVVGLAYVFFRLYLRMRSLDRQVTLLVRELALRDVRRDGEAHHGE